MASVSLKGVNKYYGDMRALSDVSLDIEHGEFAVFVGPSGCGKSTLLRSIAGLEAISDGAVEIDGLNVTQTAPSDRDVAMVFQTYALYPHMTVHANMEFGMKVNGVPADARQARVEEAARVLQLESYMERKPGQLSGGQRQRVAIGRAIVKNPKVFLFDEPLSNLDAKLRIQMRIELEALHKQLGATMIYVTHDQVEAMTMADKIVVLNAGVIEQIGSPLDLYHRPRTRFVADFIGSPGMNFMDVHRVDQHWCLAEQPLCAVTGDADVKSMGIRPEHIDIVDSEPSGVMLKIEVKESLGAECYLYARHQDTDTLMVIKSDGDDPHKVGDVIGVMFPEHRLHQFDTNDVTVPR